MAEKVQYIEELSEKTLKDLLKRDSWIAYLQSAANLYKYNFRDSYLIYAQKPEATAVASFDLWNNVMHRYVNKGSKGIALIDRKSSKPRLHYVFDISDTHGNKAPYIWQYKDEYQERINEELADSFDIETPSAVIDATIETIVSSLIDDTMPELLSELKYSIEGSFFEDLDDLNLEAMLRKTLQESINATVLFRCQIDTGLDANDFDKFSYLYNFNTADTMILLGTTVSDITETVLREIELSVKAIEREERNQKRSKEYGNELQRSRRTAVPRIGAHGTDNRAADEVWQHEEGLSGTPSSGTIQSNADARDAVPPLQGKGAGDESTNEPTDRADEETDAEKPVANTHNGDRERADAGADTDKISEQDAIDNVLLNGSGFEEGKQRIVGFYYKYKSNKERTDFLKKEYGTGGRTFTFSGDKRGHFNYSAKGIEIYNNGYNHQSISLTWAKAAKRIGELIENERYFEPRHPDEKPLIKPIIDTDTETQGADEAPFSMEKKDTAQEETGQSGQKKA